MLTRLIRAMSAAPVWSNAMRVDSSGTSCNQHDVKTRCLPPVVGHGLQPAEVIGDMLCHPEGTGPNGVLDTPGLVLSSKIRLGLFQAANSQFI